MSEAIRVGILGDFNPGYDAHQATNEAIGYAASKLGLPVQGNAGPRTGPGLEDQGALRTLDLIAGWGRPGACRWPLGARARLGYNERLIVVADGHLNGCRSRSTL